MLSSETNLLVERMKSMDWFSQVGQPLHLDSKENLVLCGSWTEANLECNKGFWGSISSANSNLMYSYLSDISDEKIERYEALDETIRKSTGQIADIAISFVDNRVSSKLGIRTRITWDIAHFLLCNEFIEDFGHCFTYRIGQWYLRGRFPCGWRGLYPDGQLIVF